MNGGRFERTSPWKIQLPIMDKTAADADLAGQILAGLNAQQKYVSSKYFYDDEGTRLFQRIMALPEYYLTRVEHEILCRHSTELAAEITSLQAAVDLIELGSGDGEKIVSLCQAIERGGAACTYYPIDLSALALKTLSSRFDDVLPALSVQPFCGDYFENWPFAHTGRRRAVLLLGSTLGNLTRESSVKLLRHIREHVQLGDVLIVGLDLQKDPQTILAAYNDREGVTAAFNLNLLRRLNRELHMDFNLKQFCHYPTYNPLDGAARSFLVSRRAQRVRSLALGRIFEFREGEPVHTELSQKYTVEEIHRFATESGFTVRTHFFDPREWYAVTVWQPMDCHQL